MKRTIELHKKVAVERDERMSMTVTAAIVPTFTGSKKFIEINKFGSRGGCMAFEGEQVDELAKAISEMMEFFRSNPELTG